MSKYLSEEQKRIGQEYLDKSMDVIHDQEKFDKIIQEFDEWKMEEGIE